MKDALNRRRCCKFIDATDEILKSYVKSPKRIRIKLSERQLLVLEYRYLENRHPSQLSKEGLASITGIPIKNIQIWFQNRRAKEKAENESAEMKCNNGYTNNMVVNHVIKPYNIYFNNAASEFGIINNQKMHYGYNGYEYDHDSGDYLMQPRK